MTIKHSYIIPRISAYENTHCVLSFKYIEYIKLEDSFQLFSTVISDWVKNTEEGKEKYENSSEDFNIGDLADSLSKELIGRFKKSGITDIVIDDYNSEVNTWNFDSLLVNI